MINISFDQFQNSDEKKAIGNVIACLNAANTHLKDIRQLCEQAMKGRVS